MSKLTSVEAYQIVFHNLSQELVCIYIYTHTHIYGCGGGGLVTQSCPTLETPWAVAHQAPWDFPGKNTRVDFHFLLQICVRVYTYICVCVCICIYIHL